MQSIATFLGQVSIPGGPGPRIKKIKEKLTKFKFKMSKKLCIKIHTRGFVMTLQYFRK